MAIVYGFFSCIYLAVKNPRALRWFSFFRWNTIWSYYGKKLDCKKVFMTLLKLKNEKPDWFGCSHFLLWLQW